MKPYVLISNLMIGFCIGEFMSLHLWWYALLLATGTMLLTVGELINQR